MILIPEIPFRYESVCAKIAEREREGKEFTLVVVAEGAREQGKDRHQEIILKNRLFQEPGRKSRDCLGQRADADYAACK